MNFALIDRMRLLAASTNKSVIQLLQEKLKSTVSDPHMWTVFIYAVIKIIVILVATKIITNIVRKAIQHFVIERERHPLKFDRRRTRTIGKLINNVVTYTFNFIAILLLLSQIGIKLAPLLAGAGVVGLAVGFGAQNLVKDIITGFFIIFEDQFGVGDVVQVGKYKGTVEEIGLRITRIKIWTGELLVIPNGAIGEVVNFSINNSVAVIDMSISYEQDIDFATRVLKEQVHEIFEENENIIQEPEILGVQSLGNSDVVLRITAECKPNTHFAVTRQMREVLKKAFDQNGIEIPYPRLVTYQRSEQADTEGG